MRPPHHHRYGEQNRAHADPAGSQGRGVEVEPRRRLDRPDGADGGQRGQCEGDHQRDAHAGDHPDHCRRHDAGDQWDAGDADGAQRDHVGVGDGHGAGHPERTQEQGGCRGERSERHQRHDDRAQGELRRGLLLVGPPDDEAVPIARQLLVLIDHRGSPDAWRQVEGLEPVGEPAALEVPLRQRRRRQHQPVEVVLVAQDLLGEPDDADDLDVIGVDHLRRRRIDHLVTALDRVQLMTGADLEVELLLGRGVDDHFVCLIRVGETAFQHRDPIGLGVAAVHAADDLGSVRTRLAVRAGEVHRGQPEVGGGLLDPGQGRSVRQDGVGDLHVVGWRVLALFREQGDGDVGRVARLEIARERRRRSPCAGERGERQAPHEADHERQADHGSCVLPSERGTRTRSALIAALHVTSQGHDVAGVEGATPRMQGVGTLPFPPST